MSSRRMRRLPGMYGKMSETLGRDPYGIYSWIPVHPVSVCDNEKEPSQPTYGSGTPKSAD